MIAVSSFKALKTSLDKTLNHNHLPQFGVFGHPTRSGSTSAYELIIMIHISACITIKWNFVRSYYNDQGPMTPHVTHKVLKNKLINVAPHAKNMVPRILYQMDNCMSGSSWLPHFTMRFHLILLLYKAHLVFL